MMAKVSNDKENCFSDIIKENGFELLPFLVNIHSERNLHDMDPKNPGTSRIWWIPSKDFVERLSIKRIPNQLSYVNNYGKLIAFSQAWTEGSYNERYDNRISFGRRINIKRTDILKYLKVVNKCLVLKITISRNKDNRDRTEEYDHGQSQFFILHQNGTIDGMGKNS